MRLSQKLLLAIAKYYINRNLQKKRKWDKEADLREIDEAASKLGYSAIAGTFFFRKGKKTFKMDEESFPNTVESV